MDFARIRSLTSAALRPGLTTQLAEFDSARVALTATRPVPTTVAVLGLEPRGGRTSVTALLALAVAGWSDRRVAVIDTVAAPVGRRDDVNGVPAFADVAGRSVTALLHGDVRQGRVVGLLPDVRQQGDPISAAVDVRAEHVVSRAKVRSALTPEAAVDVLSMPAGGSSRGGFPPQDLERVVARLRQRADLVLIDTPPGPHAPVLHAAIPQADHLLLVVHDDDRLAERVAEARHWVDSIPGRRAGSRIGVVVVRRGLRPPRTSGLGVPVSVIPRDEGVRRRRLDRMGRTVVGAALGLAAAIAAQAEQARTPSPVVSPVPVGPGPGQMMGTPPHLGQLREPLPRR